MRLVRRLLIVVVGLWLVAEIVAIPVAGQLVGQRAAQRVNGAAAAHGSVGSFPILARVLFFQRVSSVSVTFDHIEGRVPFASVRFDVHGVGFDRASLFAGKPRVTSIDNGSVTATINLADVSPVASRVSSRVRVEGRTLFVGAVALALRSDLFPCSPQAQENGGTVTLSCTFNEIPPALFERTQN